MRHLIAALTLVLLAGCGDGGTEPDPRAAVAGTYDLRAIDDMAVPVVLQDDAEAYAELTSGEMTLRRDGTYHEELIVNYQLAGEPPAADTSDENGTFTLAGDQITFRPAGFTYSGVVGNGTLAYTYEGNVYRFERR